MTPTLSQGAEIADLKPCPFCGGAAHVSYSDRGEVFSVRCNHWTEVGGSKVCMGSGAYASTEAEAIAAWNRRKTPAGKKSMTLNLTEAEMDALEALAKKQELNPERVLIQGLRRYQLFINGEPDLGPMLPPDLASPVPNVPPQENEGVSAWAAIVAERARQIESERWTAAHDDQHRDGELLRAAVIYLHHDPASPHLTPMVGAVPMGWPWAPKWWKPKDRRSNLVRAGALCLAERDRLVRAGRLTGAADHKLDLAMRNLSALASPSPATARAGEPVAWINGERELALRWMQRLLATLSTKPDHADDCLWLERLHGLLAASSDQSRVERLEAALRNALPAYEIWMDDHADDMKSATCRQLTFGELRAAYALLGDRS